MENMAMIDPGEVSSKLLCSKVDDEIDVSGIIRGDVEEVFIGEFCINKGTGSN
jgi:hypothetical protein